MTIIESLLFNSLFVLFPLFSYFLFAATEYTLNKRTKMILFDLALYTALYLLFKYDVSNTAIKMMFLTVPLLIAYLKNKKITAIIFSICIGIYYINEIQVDIIWVILEMIIYFILIYLLKLKKQTDVTIISVFAIIKITFITLELFLITNNDSEIVKQIIILPFVFYFVLHLLCYLMNASEKIMNLHMTIKELEHQKQLQDSLFKITHEIKNPIAVCKGYLDILDINNGNNARRYIPIIKQEIERTLMLMNDFMMLTKINVDKRKMDISVLLADVCETIYFMAGEKKIKFEYSIIDDEIYIEGDYDRLKQVLINIVKNAIEAIPNDKKGIIKFITKLTSKEIIMTINDNGIGMSKEVLNKIGEPFYTTKKGGSGLGVKFSKEIIETHQGSIKYKSKINVGTMVTITLPLKKSC